MKYIASSTPEELLEGIVSYIREFSGKGESIQVSSSLEYDSDKNTWSIKIRVTKLPTLDDIVDVDRLREVDPDGTAQKTVELTLEAPDSDYPYVDKGDIDSQLKEGGLLRSYNIRGKLIKTYSLVSAVDKYIDSVPRDGFNYRIGGYVFASRHDAFAALLNLEIASRSPLRMRASVNPAGVGYVADLLSNLFPTENFPTREYENDNGTFIGDLDLNPVVEKKPTADEIFEVLSDAIFTDSGIIDLSAIKDIPDEANDTALTKTSSVAQHPVAIALERTFPFIRRANFNPDTNVAELIIDDYTKILWHLRYDDETKEVDGVDGLVQAVSQTVKAKVTPFGEKETPRWKLVEQDGTFIFQPAE